VARPTRQARRERREQQRADRERDNGAGGARRPPAATATADPGAPQPARPEAELAPGVKHRGGVIGFIGECIAELKKVEWPGQKQVITGTVVVIVACTIVGIYLWGIDQLIRPLIERLI
jgi:preprotein translocase SecE subunit